MSSKKPKQEPSRSPSGYDHLPEHSDFYSGSPSEQPLYEDRPLSESRRVRKTGRHQAVSGRRKETIDPREKMALMAILKSTVMILLLVIAFFMLRKGIKLYEESIWIDNQTAPEAQPVMREVALIEDFDIESQDAPELFSERIEIWKRVEVLVRSADGLLKRNNYDQAIERCNEALRLDPFHMGALERLGQLYRKTGRNVEAVNAYIRLLSVDPSRKDLQGQLIEALDAYGDSDAVAYMARWYLDQNEYNADVQRYLAHSLFVRGEYAEAAKSYDRVLKDSPGDVNALELQAQSYLNIEDYAKALGVYDKLRETNYRDQKYYRQIAVCNAQLGKSQETVQTLGRAAHLFGQNTVVGWMQDPLLVPIREDRTFQAFADRVGGEEFRKWLEKVAKTMEGEDRDTVVPQLKLPDQEGALDKELLLKPRK